MKNRNTQKKQNKMRQKVSHLRLLLPCVLTAVMVFDGLMGYTAPDPFNGLEVVTPKAYAAEVPELEIKAQTGTKVTGKGPAGKLGKTDESGEYSDGVYTGSARGFGGQIKVEVTVKGGKLSDIRILSASGETGSYLSRAKGVISKMLSKNSTNVDAISGATYSSNGIIKAVRNALEKAKKKKTAGKKNTLPEAPAKPSLPAKPVALTGGNWTDGEYTGEGEGFGGKLHVKVTVKDGKITLIELLDNNDGADYIGKAEKSIFPEVMNRQGTDVDAVTGATFSSYGLIAAINDALSKAAGRDGGSDQGSESGGSDAGGTGTDSGNSDSDIIYKDGTYRRTVACTSEGTFDYDINITLVVSDGSITSLSIYKGEDWTEPVEDQAENDQYLNMAVNGYGSRSGMIRKILDAQSADVDTVTGATYSSNAVRSAVADILSGIRTEKREDEPDEMETADPAAGTAAGTTPDASEAGDPASADGTDDSQPADEGEPAEGEQGDSGSSDSGQTETPAPAEEAPAQEQDKGDHGKSDSGGHTETPPAPEETAAPASLPENTEENNNE